MHKIKIKFIFALVLLFSSLPGNAIAEDPFFSVGAGFDYASGDFGSDTTTEFVTIPLIVDIYPNPRTDIEITLPYIMQSDTTKFYNTSIPYQNRYMGGRSAQKSANNAQGLMGNGGDSNSSTQTPESDTDNNKSVKGMGDVTLSAGYAIIEETSYFPQIRLTAFLKLPTADEEDGLGSGEFDFGPGFSFNKWIGDINLSAEGKYVFCGESDIYPAKDYLSYSLASGYAISDGIIIGVSGNGATRTTEDGTAPLEARLKLNIKIINGVWMEGYAAKGLTDGSPDYAASVSIFKDF